MTWRLSSLRHEGCLERIDNRDIKSAVFASGMSWDEDVGRLAPFTW